MICIWVGFFFQLVIDSPVSPMTSILPLIFVVTVTAVKQVRKPNSEWC